mmetsp:Transcript_49270/g.141680  ORF Transcript_49270/g.141680 Transcript_49270/m.141680 type:complete len:218 (-) Transcript_49270:1422-2075(-)
MDEACGVRAPFRAARIRELPARRRFRQGSCERLAPLRVRPAGGAGPAAQRARPARVHGPCRAAEGPDGVGRAGRRREGREGAAPLRLRAAGRGRPLADRGRPAAGEDAGDGVSVDAWSPQRSVAPGPLFLSGFGGLRAGFRLERLPAGRWQRRGPGGAVVRPFRPHGAFGDRAGAIGKQQLGPPLEALRQRRWSRRGRGRSPQGHRFRRGVARGSPA